MAPGLLDDDLTHQSLYALLEGYGVQLTHGRRAVEAEVASDTLAESLGVSPGAAGTGPPQHLVRGVRPVEVFVAYHRGDRSRFEVTLNRSKPVDADLQPLMRVTG